MKIEFSKDIDIDTSSMLDKHIAVDGKLYIVNTSAFNFSDSGIGKSITALEVKVQHPPIPQINIETPEEKEALDLIDTTPHQYESVASKEVEWVNGDECRYSHDINHEYIYIGEHPNGDGHYVFSEEKGITYIANGYLIEPETPQQREERERMKNGQSLYELVQSLWCTVDSKYTPHPYNSPMVDDKIKEMYARLARAVNYRVEGE